jgi:hypothetical protein
MCPHHFQTIPERVLAAEDKLVTLVVVAREPFAAERMRQDWLCYPRLAMVLYFRPATQEATDSNLVSIVAHLGVEDREFVD